MPGPEWWHVCRFFFLNVNITIFWFVLTLELSARLQNTRQSICSEWNKTLENQPTNLKANSGLEGILSKPFFCSEEGFKVRTTLSLFTVNCKRSLPTPFCEFWHVTAPNRHAHVRITPIVRRIRNSWETRPLETLTYVRATLQDIRTSFCALIRRRTIQTVLTSAWAGWNAGYSGY